MVFLIVTAMLNLSVATHYCGGEKVASKLSLTGKLADCGMEGAENGLPPHGTNFNNNCCDNVVTSGKIDSNYIPSFSFVPDYYKYNFQILSIPTGSPVYSTAFLKSLYSDVGPPGVLMAMSVDLSDICVFRV